MQFLPLLLFLIGVSTSALTPRACLGRPGSYIPGELQLYGSADTSGPYNYYLSAGYTTPCAVLPTGIQSDSAAIFVGYRGGCPIPKMTCYLYDNTVCNGQTASGQLVLSSGGSLQNFDKIKRGASGNWQNAVKSALCVVAPENY